jgi:hypothetical protein
LEEEKRREKKRRKGKEVDKSKRSPHNDECRGEGRVCLLRESYR